LNSSGEKVFSSKAVGIIGLQCPSKNAVVNLVLKALQPS